jgi:2-keto-3-deoxy-L-rhamnonate aldolase RhmA
MFKNLALEKMRGGQLALGVVLRQARTVDIARAMKACDVDWLFIDLEHNSMTLDIAAQISMTSLDAGIAPIVRVPMMELTMATRALDNGALGIIMPHVETEDETKKIVSALRYPPIGHRSVTSALPHYSFRLPPLQQALATINNATMIVLNIETPLGVDNIEDIAAVEGVDVLLIGAVDLAAEMGLHGQYKHPDVVAAFEKVLDAGRRNNKHVGIGGITDDADWSKWIKAGMRFMVSGSDIFLLMSAASEKTAKLRNMQ